MIELIKKTEAERLLDRFIDSEKNPENTIRLVFVPEELYSDLKDKGISHVDLLYYDKAVASVGSNALKELIALNALSKSSPLDKSRVYESVEMSEKLTPLMGEALDIRLLWLANANDKEAFYSQYFPQENGEHTFEEEVFNTTRILSKVMTGICNNIYQHTNENCMYESIDVSPSGRIYFISVPTSTVEGSYSEHTLKTYVLEKIRDVMRKSSIYHSEQTISATALFGNYLLLLDN